MLKGTRSWIFPANPAIESTGVVGGPFEKKGNLSADFDQFYDDLWMGQDTYEKASRTMIEDAVQIALEKRITSKKRCPIFFNW